MKRKVLMTALSCAAMLALIIAAVGASNENIDGTQAGEAVRQAQENSSPDTTVMTVNGVAISEREFEVYKATMEQIGSQASDEELLSKLAETQVLFDEAKARGYTASEDEIDEAITFTRETLMQADQSETRSFIESYIEELGISEDEYWESIRPTYEKSIAIGKLQDSLKAELAEEASSDVVAAEEFNSYYESFTQELVSKAEIVLES